MFKNIRAFSLLLALTTATAVAQERQRSGRPSGPRYHTPPTHANVKYGPYERNVMDMWLAKSDKPTPVLVSIHGGGFSHGNKSVNSELLDKCLQEGISVVATTYRLSDEAKAPAQFFDSARAIQVIRSKSKEWNLDGSRMAATGGSAGAGISLWLAFHDDLADPKSEESRTAAIHAADVCGGDQRARRSDRSAFHSRTFPGSDTYKVSALAQLFDMDPNNLDDLPAEKYKLFEAVSPINFLTRDDPPVQLLYTSKMDTPITNQGVGIHHPRFGKALKDKMDALGIECEMQTGIALGSDSAKLVFAFIQKHFGMK